MSEHAGRIPLVRRRRRKPPKPHEWVAIFWFALQCLNVVLLSLGAATDGSPTWRTVDLALLGVNALSARYDSGPVAVPALLRWWWGE